MVVKRRRRRRGDGSGIRDVIRAAMLRDPKLRELPDGEIAERIGGTSRQTVGQERARLEAEGRIPVTPRKVKRADGRVQTLRVGPARQTECRPFVPRRSSDRQYILGRWDGYAERAGIDADALHQLAAEKLAEDRKHRAAVRAMLRRARELARSLGSDLAAVRLRHAQQGIDHAGVRGLDDVAKSMADAFPEAFNGHEDYPERRLWELLLSGVTRPLSEEEAYHAAAAYLESHGEPWGGLAEAA